MSLVSAVNSNTSTPNPYIENFNELPVEMCMKIFSFCPFDFLIPMRLTCKSWHYIINEMIDPRLTFIDSSLLARWIHFNESPSPNNNHVNKVVKQLSKSFDPFSELQDYCFFYLPEILDPNITKALLDRSGCKLNVWLNTPGALSAERNFIDRILMNVESGWVLLGDFCVEIVEHPMGVGCSRHIIEQRAFSDWSAEVPIWRKATVIELLIGNMLKKMSGKSKIGITNTKRMAFTTPSGGVYTPYLKLDDSISLSTPIHDKDRYPIQNHRNDRLPMQLDARKSGDQLRFLVHLHIRLRYSNV